jgi:TRAP-type C4-dicarboxylate transport system permease small subunit
MGFGVLLCVILAVLLYSLGSSAWDSVKIREKTFSLFESPLYPVRVAAVVGIILLFVQVIANFTRNLYALISAKRG